MQSPGLGWLLQDVVGIPTPPIVLTNHPQDVAFVLRCPHVCNLLILPMVSQEDTWA